MQATHETQWFLQGIGSEGLTDVAVDALETPPPLLQPVLQNVQHCGELQAQWGDLLPRKVSNLCHSIVGRLTESKGVQNMHSLSACPKILPVEP